MLPSESRLVCPPSCLVLSYLCLLPVCCLSFNAVSPGVFKKLFYVPDSARPRALLLRLTELTSIEAEIDTRKLLFLGRLVTELRACLIKMSNPLVFCRVSARRQVSMICLITSKHGSTVQPFLRMATGNQLSKIKFVTWRVNCGRNFFLVIRTCMLHELA